MHFGTGTDNGRVQRELGPQEFTRLVRYAYDRGIRFFETADSYYGIPEMLGAALKGIPRDSYQLMTKLGLREAENPHPVLDRMRTELNTEYFDVLLIHCVRTPHWMNQFQRLRDQFSEGKQKRVILAHGASCHGLQPLRTFPTDGWLDVALLRVNHDGTKMDTPAGQDTSPEKGDVQEVTSYINAIHGRGTGVIGMKLFGEGAFKTAAQRDESIRFVMNLGTVDAVTVGFKSPEEIDETILRIDTHLNT